MRDHPIAVQRLLTLRQFPGFADAELAELATIAENVVEATFRPGSIVAAAGNRVPAIHLVVEGQIESVTPRDRLVWRQRQLFGALEVMAGQGLVAPAIAVVETRTLQLAAADYAELLEDNFGLLSSVRRALARRRLLLGGRSEPAAYVDAPGGSPLGMVERLIQLRKHVPFAAGRIQALAALARSTDEIQLPAGSSAGDAGDAVTKIDIVLDGVLRGHRPNGESRVFATGSAIGGLEALAEVAYDMTIEAITPVRLLRCPAIALFDVMEDHTDFGLATIAMLAGELLEAPSVATVGALRLDDRAN